jgi:hypothetical protein
LTYGTLLSSQGTDAHCFAESLLLFRADRQI